MLKGWPGKWWNRKSSGPQFSSNSVSWIVNPYHAISVHSPAGHCPAASAIAGKRFLSREAPTFPLPGCEAGSCKCTYQHHDDRRADPRRATERLKKSLQAYKGLERRQHRGRRADDLVD